MILCLFNFYKPEQNSVNLYYLLICKSCTHYKYSQSQFIPYVFTVVNNQNDPVNRERKIAQPEDEQVSEREQAQRYLVLNTASKQLEFKSAGGVVEVVMSLVGLDGVAKVFKFVFNNKDTLFQVFSMLKCFFNGGGT